MAENAGAAPTSRRDRRKSETRERLLQAAYELVSENGEQALVIQAITERADVGFGSFYNHFASRDEIFQAVIEARLGAFAERMDRMAAGIDDPAEVIVASMRHVMREAISDPQWGWFAVRASGSMDFLRFGFGPRLMRDIRAAIRAGRVQSSDVKSVALYIIGGTVATTVGLLTREISRKAPEECAYRALLLLGMRAEEAREVANRALPPLPA